MQFLLIFLQIYSMTQPLKRKVPCGIIEIKMTKFIDGIFFCSFLIKLTQVIFKATNLKPLASKRLRISPTSPRWTPSGLTMIKVRSWLPAIIFAMYERNANKVQIIDDHTTWNNRKVNFYLTQSLC